MKVKIKNLDSTSEFFELSGQTINVSEIKLYFNKFLPQDFNRFIMIPESIVDTVIDDARIGKSKCCHCSAIVYTGDVCTRCEYGDQYLEEFIPGSIAVLGFREGVERLLKTKCY